MDDTIQDSVPQVATEDTQVTKTPPVDNTLAAIPADPDVPMSATNDQSAPATQAADGQAAQYDTEIKSDKIETKRKTFFLDLKANAMGRYVKISERSSGKRSTVIVPEENIAEFMEKLQGLFK